MIYAIVGFGLALNRWDISDNKISTEQGKDHKIIMLSKDNSASITA